MKPLKRLVFGLTFLVAAAGSSTAQQSDAPVTSRPLDPPPASLTLDLGEQSAIAGEVFRVGFLADAAPGHQRRLFLPFRRHMEAVLSRPVELVPFRDARGLMMAMQRQDIGYAMAPSNVFVATHRLCGCVTPIGAQPNRDGSPGLFSVMLALDDGRVRDLGSLADARLAIVGQGSVIAHRVGLSELWRAELQLAEDRFLFTTTLEDAADALVTGEVEAVLSWSRQAEGGTLFDSEPANALDQHLRTRLRIVWRSRPVPGLTHYHHTELPDELAGTLQSMLLDLTGRNGDAFDAIDQGSGRAFIARTLQDFDPLLDAYDFWDREHDTAEP